MDRIKQPFNPNQSYTLNSPTILDQDGKNPRCMTFEDMYFMPDSGFAEVDHVFLAGNGLPSAWSADSQGEFYRQQDANPSLKSPTRSTQSCTQSFTIAELGFGTGLNVFRAVSLWLTTPQPRWQRLHVISTELQPLAKEQLAAYASLHPIDEGFMTAFLHWYPENLAGQFRFNYRAKSREAGGEVRQVTIDLLHGDALAMLGALHLPLPCYDALFLDGFAPKKNPDLWSKELLATLAKGAQPGHTRLATFTAARLVRDNLSAAGFRWQKVPGVRGKKHNIIGCYDPSPCEHEHEHSGTSEEQEATLPHQRESQSVAQPRWGQAKDGLGSAPKAAAARDRPNHVVVIGAGLAGSQAAYALAQRGIKVTVVDSGATVAAGASGNHQGALYTRITKGPTAVSQFYLRGFFYARQQLKALGGSPKAKIYQPTPLLSLLADEDAQAEAKRLLTRHRFSANFLTITSKYGRQWLANHLSASVSPPALCQRLLGHSAITLSLGHRIEKLSPTAQGVWRLEGSRQAIHADAVVLAASYAVDQLWPLAYLGIKAIRGQVSYLAAASFDGPEEILTADRYLLPSLAGVATAGASFNLHHSDPALRPEDREYNLAAAAALLGQPLSAAAVVGERVSFRGVSKDYLPIVGKVPDYDLCQERFGYLAKDAKQPVDLAAVPYHRGLYLSVAHGSRGLSSAALCGEILAAEIAGEPAPVEQSVLRSLAPERYIWRQLIRGR